MTGLLQEVRQALRRMAKAPGLTAAVIVTLAVAIGLDTAAFSLIDALLLRSPPVERPAELVHVYTASDDGLLRHGPLAFPDYLDLRERAGSFAALAAYAQQPLSIGGAGSGGDGDRNELMLGEVVTGDYFATLGLEAARGRLLSAADDRPGAPPGVVLSHAAWHRRFAADPGAVGRVVRLSGHAFTVVGVAPRGFSGLVPGLATDLWVPVHAAERLPTGITVGFGSATPGASRLEDRSRRWIWTVGRLRPGTGLDAARAEVETLGRRLAAEHPRTHGRRTFAVEAVEDVRILPGVDGALRAGALGLLGLAGLVLLVAATNVANLLLAGAVARRRETVTRLSLGASRWRLARQHLVESLLLALAGGVGGVALAAGLPGLLGAVLPKLPWPVDIARDLRLNPDVLLFALGVSAGTAVLFGLAPVFESLRTDLAGALRGAGSTPESRRRRSVGSLSGSLVVVQVAVSVVLLVGLGLTTRSLVRAHAIDPGLDPSGRVVATFAPELQGYSADRVEEIFRRLEEGVEGLPGVASVSVASHLPLTYGLRLGSVAAEDGAERRSTGPAGSHEWIDVDEAAVGPGYFETLGIRLMAGRGFREGDHARAARVAVVNETLAARLWPEGGVVGRTLRLAGEAGSGYRVVGVARDGKYRTVGEPPRPFLYRALAQNPVGTRTLVARVDPAGESGGDPRRVLSAVERVAREVDPTLPVLRLRSYEEVLGESFLLPRAAAGLFGVFGMLAVGLAAVGLHGVLAHAAVRRTREIGVRMALGASRRNVVTLVVGQGLRLTALGLALGLAGGSVLGGAVRSILYGVSPADPAALLGAPAAFLAVALLASWLPARRASRAEPAAILR